MRHPALPPRGFTLVEILIVVVILGVLATIVIAQVAVSTDDTRATTFTSQLKTFLTAEAVYRERTGEYLEDASSGVIPEGFESYIDRDKWENGTPIGGVWDAQADEDGIISSIGVHFNGMGSSRDAAYMQRIDRAIDDGDLSSGAFRQFAPDRYYFVIAE
ncbi:MAG TPA: type II secretion system protein [Tepidisphaeraceae bacterium]|nr:type II secretion system protein [Tepidisphaeraceae bacterium]